MKSALFRFAWWLARKTAPFDHYTVAMCKAYNDGSVVYAISLDVCLGEDDVDAMRELSDRLGKASDDARQKAAERQLDLEIEATLAAHAANT